mmetsp:Transcript_1415/g.213  ORF Transcript_1415/g.213 Transcript_1415/m.213 type:complete len:101 (+) Transcript_1415:162-464(+)
MSSSSSSYIESKARCTVHHAGVSLYHPPKWSENLVEALTGLVSNNKNAAYWEFFENFGTHITVEIDLGAIFGYKFKMNKTETQKMKSKGVSVEAGAKAYG